MDSWDFLISHMHLQYASILLIARGLPPVIAIQGLLKSLWQLADTQPDTVIGWVFLGEGDGYIPWNFQGVANASPI